MDPAYFKEEIRDPYKLTGSSGYASQGGDADASQTHLVKIR